MNQHHDFGGSLLTSMITAGVALLPDYAVNYAEKVLSVLVLAMVAEAGRRLVGSLWGQKK